jgi:hypothetical protein
VDIYEDFRELAKKYHMNVGQAVFRLALIRRYREPCGHGHATLPGAFPKSRNYIAFVETFPCAVCEDSKEKRFGMQNIRAYRLVGNEFMLDKGSDYTAIPLCKKCSRDPLSLAMARAYHCAVQNRLFETYIRYSEGV